MSAFKQLKPETLALIVILSFTIVIWMLRGVSLLSFIPGWILWALIFLACGMIVVALLQWTR